MDEEHKEWYRRYSASFGVREFLRFGCIFLFWMFLGIALSVIFRSSKVLIFFLIAPFVFTIIAPRWKPAYHLLRLIWGNKDLPHEPYPRSTAKIPGQSLPAWAYMPGIWGWLMGSVLLYAFIRYLSK